MKLKVCVTTPWFNGWFLKLFAKPFIVIDGNELPAEWGKSMEVDTPKRPVEIGAGVRYFSSGPLGGVDPVTVDPTKGNKDSHKGDTTIVLRNGFWNHTPFRVVS